jgi:hypothetical protein
VLLYAIDGEVLIFFSSFAKQGERERDKLRGLMFLLAYTALQGWASKQGRKEGRERACVI